MIKINKSIIVIISLSLFLFLCYNVLTAEAKVDLNKEYTWTNADGTKDKVTLQDFEVEDVEESCDASEDYTRNEKLCDELYKMKEESDEANKKQQQENIEKACDKAGAKLNEKGECNIHGDGPKADKFYEEQAKLEQEEKSVINEDGRNTVTTTEDDEQEEDEPQEDNSDSES